MKEQRLETAAIARFKRHLILTEKSAATVEKYLRDAAAFMAYAGGVRYMSCASIGVLNGYAYATQNLKQAEQMWAGVCADNARLLISQILRSSMLQHNIADIYDPGKRLSATFYASLLDISHRSLTYKDLSAVEPETVLSYLKASVAMPIYNRVVRPGL